jgi:hypothetical protein
MAREAAAVDQPRAALLFALGCAAWAARMGLINAFKTALTPDRSETGEESTMAVQDVLQGRGLALLCAIAATLLGLIYLGVAGAPDRLLIMNLAALVAGLLVAGPFMGREPVKQPMAGMLAVLIGASLLVAAIWGDQASGARRWVSIGEVILQPSLVLLPLLVVCFARSRTVLTALGVALAAIAMALQPDRAMAGALVAGLGAIVLATRDRTSLVCLVTATLGFAVTLVRPDVVPATPFVDRVFLTAFSTSAVAGLAVWIGALLLLLPGALGVVRDTRHRAVFAGFGACWAAVVIAAIVGDYPTPLVAYGGSAIVGYILAAIGLPRLWSLSYAGQGCDAQTSAARERPDAHLVIASR